MKTSRSADNPNKRPASRRLARLGAAAVMATLLIGAVAAVWAISRSKQESASPLAAGQTWRVKRGPLVVSLLAPGTVKAKVSTEIKCLVHGDVKITWIVDEGTIVKAGDKLVELESSELQEQTIRQRISVASEQADYDSAKQNLEIQKSKNFTDLMKAQNTYDMASLDLDKYVNGDYKQKLREAESDITVAQAELKRARERLEGTKKLLAKGYVNKGELEADTLAETKQKIELEKATNAKELLEKYEYKREVSKLETDKRAAEEELKRTRQSNESELANRKIELEAAKSRLDLELYQLANLEEQLKNTVVYAPQAGMVVYYQEDGRSDENSRIRVGTQVHHRQKLIDLPDFTSWRVQTRVHESMIQQVKLSQRGIVTIDAFQGQSIEGRVAYISVLPDGGRWFMPDTKEYLIDLDLTTTTLPLKPGMSTKAEILLDSLKDVLQVPVQALSTQNGKTMVWVGTETGTRPQVVEVGLNNDRFAEIRSGLSEGDVIVMRPDTAPAADLMRRPSENENDGKTGQTDKEKTTAAEEKSRVEAKADAQPAAKAEARQVTADGEQAGEAGASS